MFVEGKGGVMRVLHVGAARSARELEMGLCRRRHRESETYEDRGVKFKRGIYVSGKEAAMVKL
jgi:hypothetical protein